MATSKRPSRPRPRPAQADGYEYDEEAEPDNGTDDTATVFHVADIEAALTGTTVTMTYEVKVPIPGVEYSNQGMRVELTADLPEGPLLDSASTVQGMAAILKMHAYSALGVPFEVDEATARVTAVFDAFSDGGGSRSGARKGGGAAKKAPAKRTSGARKAPAKGRGRTQKKGPTPQAEEAWNHLMENGPELWWDNRDSKQSDKSPDFKIKNEEDIAEDWPNALWLNSKPDWFDEDEFDAAFYADEEDF